MIIYTDSDFKCHVDDVDGRTAYDVQYFDGKCKAFIEGYIYLPQGVEQLQEDGTVLHGEMISPWRDSSLLAELQQQYEEMLAEQADMRAALELLGVSE